MPYTGFGASYNPATWLPRFPWQQRRRPGPPPRPPFPGLPSITGGIPSIPGIPQIGRVPKPVMPGSFSAGVYGAANAQMGTQAAQQQRGLIGGQVKPPSVTAPAVSRPTPAAPLPKVRAMAGGVRGFQEFPEKPVPKLPPGEEMEGYQDQFGAMKLPPPQGGPPAPAALRPPSVAPPPPAPTLATTAEPKVPIPEYAGMALGGGGLITAPRLPQRPPGTPEIRARWQQIMDKLGEIGNAWGMDVQDIALSPLVDTFYWDPTWHLPTDAELNAMTEREQLLALVGQLRGWQVDSRLPGAQEEEPTPTPTPGPLGDPNDPQSYTGGRTNTWDDIRNYVAWLYDQPLLSALTAEELARARWVTPTLPSVDDLIIEFYYGDPDAAAAMIYRFYQAARGYLLPPARAGGGGNAAALAKQTAQFKKWLDRMQRQLGSRALPMGAAGGYRAMNAWY